MANKRGSLSAHTAVNRLLSKPDIRVGVISRNITEQPEESLQRLYQRDGVGVDAFDFLIHVHL